MTGIWTPPCESVRKSAWGAQADALLDMLHRLADGVGASGPAGVWFGPSDEFSTELVRQAVVELLTRHIPSRNAPGLTRAAR